MVGKIGNAAGDVYRALKKEGELAITNLHKKTGLPVNLFYMGLGWLAREDKLSFRHDKRIVYVRLEE